MQIGVLISHLLSVEFVKKNIQLVISQVKKWVLDKGLGAKTSWEYSIPKILLSINGRLICLYNFIFLEIMLGFVLD